MAYTPEDVKRLQEQYPNVGPILGPLVDKFVRDTKTQVQNPYQNAGGGAGGIGAVVGSAGKTVLDDYNRYFNTLIGDPLRAYGQVGKDFLKGVVSTDTSEPKNIPAQPTNNKPALPDNGDPYDTKWIPESTLSNYQKNINNPSRLVDGVEINNQGVQGYMTDSAMDRRRAAEQAAVRPGLGSIQDSAKLVRQAQLESDYNKGVINNPNSLPINVTAGSQRTLAPFFVDPSKQVGTAQYSSGTPFEPSMGLSAPPMDKEFNGKRMDMPLWTKRVMSSEGATTGPMTVGGSDVPLYETNYRDKDGKVIATITGPNQRVGGGTLSVVSGRTPEEQAAIDANVASIEKQTAAMRGLRNANRLAQGLPTVEQEEQMASIRSTMNQLAPAPDMSGLNEQQAGILKQLNDAGQIRGMGNGKLRKDLVDIAQIGLGNIANQREALQRAQQHQQGLVQNLMQNQATQDQNQAATALKRLQMMQEQAQFDSTYGQKNAELAQRGQQHADTMDEKKARFALDKINSIREADRETAQRLDGLQAGLMKNLQDWYGTPEGMSEKGNGWLTFAKSRIGLEPYSNAAKESAKKTGGFYASPRTGFVMFVSPGGEEKEIPYSHYQSYMVNKTQ